MEEPIIPMDEMSKLESLRKQLDNERSSFMVDWRTLSEYISPHRPRFTLSRTNRGGRQNDKILDNTATRARNILSSGMQSGVTNPARKWFGLTTPDPDLARVANVKNMLHMVNERMLSALLKTNFYKAMPIMYGDVATYGTAAVFVEKDPKNILHFFPLPIGSFMLGQDRHGKVNVYVRELKMTVRQLVDTFGIKNTSIDVQQRYLRNQTEDMVEIVHCVKPNEKHDPQKLDGRFKKYISYYYERSTGGSGTLRETSPIGKMLRVKGYDHFPVLAPRWHVNAEDVYGTDCPGITSLGDVKQLQIGERRSLQGIEKQINPPMVASAYLRQHKSTVIPGGVTYLADDRLADGFRPAYQVDFRVDLMEQKQAQVRERINSSWYVDLFLMLNELDRKNITATEVMERKEEKLLAVGPVLQQVDHDVLRPCIDILFDSMMQFGQLPQPEEWPDELQGQDLRVEFRSIMHEAQKLTGVATLERYAASLSGLSQVKPEVLDKLDEDEFAELLGEALSVPPSLIRTDDMVARIREQRAEMAEQQRQAELAKTEAEAAARMGQASLDENTALAAVAGQPA